MPFSSTGDCKVVLHKVGSFTLFSYDFDINNDGTLQTSLDQSGRWATDRVAGMNSKRACRIRTPHGSAGRACRVSGRRFGSHYKSGQSSRELPRYGRGQIWVQSGSVSESSLQRQRWLPVPLNFNHLLLIWTLTR
jgi:hypothetical protein